MTRARWRIVHVVVACAIVALVIACQQALGIDGPVAPTDVCGLQVGAGACQQCLAANCCAQASACAGDHGCAALESCTFACGADYDCRLRCASQNPTSESDVPHFAQCLVARCSDACGLSCGIVVSTGSAEDGGANGCVQCLVQYDCEGTKTCFSDLGCQLAGSCVANCTTPDCANACLYQSDGGQALVAFGISTARCLQACGYAHQWQCAGSKHNPVGATTQIALSLTIVDMSTRSPLPGVTVKACNPLDFTCTSAAASGATNAQGLVVLTLTMQGVPNAGFTGYFDISAADGSVVPYLLYPNYPITEPMAQLTFGVPTPTWYGQLVASSGVVVPADRATVLGNVGDCTFAAAPGVSVSADGTDMATVRAYYAGGTLDPNASGTDATGKVFFLDAPPDATITLHGTPADVGHEVSTVTVHTRAGAVAAAFVYPSPNKL
jgi:hypothetical protein